jgi:hypothetical protein
LFVLSDLSLAFIVVSLLIGTFPTSCGCGSACHSRVAVAPAQVFRTLMSSPDTLRPESMGTSAFDAFEHAFRFLNRSCLRHWSDRSMMVLMRSELQGLDALWSVAMQVRPTAAVLSPPYSTTPLRLASL